MKQSITWERLTDLLEYNPYTGVFTWLRGRQAGKRAGYLSKADGYRRVMIDGRNYLEHRLTWFVETGRWPDLLDHETGDKSWNVMDNLRRATNAQNAQNKRSKVGKALPKGVHEISSGFRARIGVGGKNRNLGTFSTPELAAAAYAIAARSLFGEYARA